MLSMDQAQALIAAEARRRGHDLGWRLLMSPWATLANAKVAIITMNPGTPRDSARVASAVEKQPDRISVEEGCAYVHEKWWNMRAGEAPLQQQLRRLIALTGEEPDEVLAGNLVPFASRRWVELPDRQGALQFGVELWRRLLAEHRPERVFTLSTDIFDAFKEVVGAGDETCFPSGWGSIQLRRSYYPGGVMVGLPHLSQFKLFGGKKRVEREQLFRTAASL